MGFSGFLFLSWRLFEIVMLIPPVGMLAYFVHGYVESNQLTPNFVLVLFVTTVLALAWAFFTTVSYVRARHDAMFVALVDLGFFGALIAGVVELRAIGNANCSNFTTDSLYLNLGPFGYLGSSTGNPYADNPNKTCSMLKASFAFAIINIIAFFVTFLLALLVHRNHRDDDKIVVKREYHSSRHNHRRSASRDYRSDRDYDNRPRSGRGSGRGSTHRSSSRRQYYV